MLRLLPAPQIPRGAQLRAHPPPVLPATHKFLQPPEPEQKTLLPLPPAELGSRMKIPASKLTTAQPEILLLQIIRQWRHIRSPALRASRLFASNRQPHTLA